MCIRDWSSEVTSSDLSPEILVRQEEVVGDDSRKSTVTIRPLAGTRKRGATPLEDAAMAKDLLADPKERAEHVMLIDLARNDVGREIGRASCGERVCQYV